MGETDSRGRAAARGRIIGGTAAVVASAGLIAGALVSAGATGAGAAPVSGNLLGGDTATLDSGSGTWAPLTSGLGVSDQSQVVQSGGGAMAVTSSVAQSADGYVASGTPASGTTSSAVPGNTYSGAAWVQAAGTSRMTAAILVFYNSSGGVLTAAYGQSVSDPVGSWTQLPTVTGLAPAGTASVALIADFYGMAANETHYLDTASLSAGGGGAKAVVGPLQTSGAQIYDASGPIVFRGIHRDGTQADSFPSDGEIGAIHAWGANFVRVPLNESLWVNTCSKSNPSYDPSYPSKVDAEVNSITSRHMVALLDLHKVVMTQCGTADMQPLADSRYAPSFWTAVARRYAGNSLVAFDLFNDLHDISDSVWLNGGTVTWGGVSYSAAGMQSLYNKVRSYAPNNLIVISGVNWATRPASVPVSGRNYVNGAHYYTCPTTPPPSCTTPNPSDPTPGLSNWVGQPTPVMVTEFGWPSRSDGTYAANVISYAESHGWGWDAFAWDGTTTGQFDLVADTGPNWEPAPAGMPVLNGLAAN